MAMLAVLERDGRRWRAVFWRLVPEGAIAAAEKRGSWRAVRSCVLDVLTPEPAAFGEPFDVESYEPPPVAG